jgi:hypothetical protein
LTYLYYIPTMQKMIINIILIGENVRAIWKGNSDWWNVLGDYLCRRIYYKDRTKAKELSPFPRVLGTSRLASFLEKRILRTNNYLPKNVFIGSLRRSARNIA